MPETANKISREILKRCPEAHLRVGLSLDGLEKDHDYIRGIKGNFSKFVKTAKLLSDLKKENSRFAVSVNTVFSSYNQDKIEKIYSFVNKKLKLPFNVTLVRGDTKERIASKVNVSKYLEFEKKIKADRKNAIDSNFTGSSFKRALDEIVPEVVYETKTKNEMVLPCVAGRKSIVLYEEGDLYPCELLNKSFGNVRKYNYDIPKMLKTKKAKEILSFIKNRKCSCTWECIVPLNIIYSPKKYPKIGWIWLRNIFKK
jgi:MoaA/NifB/PqqE/SkfB family radical SAM enzyme